MNHRVTDLLAALLSGTRWLDAVLLLVLLEAAGLCWWHARTGHGLRPAALLPNLAAGLCLMLALRAALTGTAPAWAMLALAGAGLAHWLDLRQRGVLRPG
jgi:hypothetical protein